MLSSAGHVGHGTQTFSYSLSHPHQQQHQQQPLQQPPQHQQPQHQHQQQQQQQQPQHHGQGQGHGHGHGHSLSKPSPLSSADNAPRSLHLNAVQAVNTHYSTPTSYTHTPPHSNSSSTTNLHSNSYSHSHANSTSNLNLNLSLGLNSTSNLPSTSTSISTPTSTLNSTSASQQHAKSKSNPNLPLPPSLASVSFASSHPPHKLRRMPGGANLAEHRHGLQHLRATSLNIPNGANNSHMNGAGASAAGAPSNSTASTTTSPGAMSSINAIAAGPGPNSATAPHGRFDGPRSPPNTAHVPCKFFRQGACQAGSACPFSHDIGAAAENVCKYFAKGNCKFGPKCANIHVLPDGRRVNYGKNGVTVSPINFGNRLNPLAYGGANSSSALTNSFMRASGSGDYTSYPNGTSEDQYRGENGLPTIDAHQYNPSGSASPYGSPPGPGAPVAGLALSPVGGAGINGLSVLDAPLPASFDSNGISHAARYGPWPASVPNKFGLESPSPSLHNAKDQRTSETLKMLHTSAFGSSEHLSPSHLGGDIESGISGGLGMGMAGSPPATLPIGEEFFGRRMMHSASNKYAKPRLLSSSAPKVDRDWDDNFLFLEEDYVPGELANEILTSAEKARRGSVRVAGDGANNEQTVSGENSAKYGSPIGAGASSPSRWNTLFERQKSSDEQHAGAGALGKSLKGTSAMFGHVGSPLRNSSLANGMDLMGSTPGQNSKGSSRPSLAGSRTGSGTENLSALTQQLQRSRLGDDSTTSLGSSPHLHPSAATSRPTNSIGAIGSSTSKDARLERHLSSGSMGSRFATPIEEENFVFSMEEDEEASMRERSRKSASGGFGNGGNSGNSAAGGTGWSYASIASKQGASKGNSAVETR